MAWVYDIHDGTYGNNAWLVAATVTECYPSGEASLGV